MVLVEYGIYEPCSHQRSERPLTRWSCMTPVSIKGDLVMANIFWWLRYGPSMPQLLMAKTVMVLERMRQLLYRLYRRQRQLFPRRVDMKGVVVEERLAVLCDGYCGRWRRWVRRMSSQELWVNSVLLRIIVVGLK